MTIDRKEIETLVRLFEHSDWDELRLEVAGLRLVLSNDAAAAALDPLDARPPEAGTAVPAGQSPPAPEPAEAATGDGLIPIRAPNLGTFYRAPKPGAAPYVEVGQAVSAATEVCLIEVMKLFTPVRAGIGGRIAEACVEDGEMVEFGAPLFLVEPQVEPQAETEETAEPEAETEETAETA